jgi:tripartite-type tricarboxylate transporter receptor subunit TctC
MRLRGKLLKINLLRVSILLCGAVTAPGRAQTEPCYQGKIIRIIAGFSAGGLSDQWARMFSRSMPTFIPGSQNIIVQNMPGASSVVASNFVYSVAQTVLSANDFGRAMIAPPGTRAELVKMLRAAYTQALEDAELLAEAKKSNLDIDYTPGEQLQKLAREVMDQSPKVVEKVKKILAE